MAPDATAIRDQSVVEQIGRIIRETLTGEHLYHIFSELQNPIPSGTELYTAPPAILPLLDELGVPADTFTANFLGLEFPGLFVERQPPDLVFAAHIDEISYVVARSTNRLALETDNLIANFAHRPKLSSPAGPGGYPVAAVRWCGVERGYQMIGSGNIHWSAGSSRPNCILTNLDGTPTAGDRIVYAPPVALDPDTSLLTGKADNRGGVAACIGMCEALTRIAQLLGVHPSTFRVGVLFPGQEEGNIGRHGEIELAFSRDSRAAGIAMAVAGLLPQAWINVDGHNLDPPAPSGVYASFVSEARGPVVPPHLLSRYEVFFKALEKEWAIDMRQIHELDGTVSRSDDNGVLAVIPKRIIPVGFSARNPHYDAGLPTTNINSLVHLASALTWLAVAFCGVHRTGTHVEISLSRER